MHERDEVSPQFAEIREDLLEGLELVPAAPDERSVVNVGGTEFGGSRVVPVIGPCTVESEDQLMRTAEFLAGRGVEVIRGGAYKPRTSPHSYQGSGERGLELLQRAKQQFGLKICTELLAVEHLDAVAEVADILQIGSRSMQNFPLLEAAGESGLPVLLKRGMSATYREWLAAAEYVLEAGNSDVILCERGIRSFEKTLRYQIDVMAPAVLHRLTDLPVLVDPSHSTGYHDFVVPAALSALAAGADGLLVETHPERGEALCDGPQQLDFDQVDALLDSARRVTEAVGRELGLARERRGGAVAGT